MVKWPCNNIGVKNPSKCVKKIDNRHFKEEDSISRTGAISSLPLMHQLPFSPIITYSGQFQIQEGKSAERLL